MKVDGTNLTMLQPFVGAQPLSNLEMPPQDVQQAAEQFEALLLGQILKSVPVSTGLAGESDQAGASLFEMAQEELARMLALGGGMGLARMITQSMFTQGMITQNPERTAGTPTSPAVADK